MKIRNLISLIIIISIIAISCVSCGNMDISGIGTFTFRHVHITTHQTSKCYNVKKWVDGSTGIEVQTEEVGPIFLSEGTYILFENKEDCPFCN